MKTAALIASAVLLGSLIPLSAHWRRTEPIAGAPPPLAIGRGPLRVYTDCEGVVEARRAWPIASPLSQPAILIELAPEGATVAAGDVIARFDPAGLDRDVIRLERDAARARAERDTLRDATHPLALAELELKQAEADAQAAAARDLLADTRDLQAEDLVSTQEVAQHERDAARLTQLADLCRRQLERTRAILHPAALARADADCEAAARELALLRAQLDGCTVKAPAAGLVVYQPVHVGGDFRIVRAGDTVYRNQSFLTVADMSELVVGAYLPETDLARVQVDQPAEVTPVAYPDLHIPARVETLGGMAYAIAGRPAWQKVVRLALRLEDAPPALRSGMTVRIRVRTYERAQALLIPRQAVSWDGATPACLRLDHGRARPTPLTLGWADDTHYEIIAGLAAGDRVCLP